jgi:hypothetical protein
LKSGFPRSSGVHRLALVIPLVLYLAGVPAILSAACCHAGSAEAQHCCTTSECESDLLSPLPGSCDCTMGELPSGVPETPEPATASTGDRGAAAQLVLLPAVDLPVPSHAATGPPSRGPDYGFSRLPAYLTGCTFLC